MKKLVLCLTLSLSAHAVEFPLFPEDIVRLTSCSGHLQNSNAVVTFEDLRTIYDNVTNFDGVYAERQKRWIAQELLALKEQGDPRKFFNGQIDAYVKMINEGEVPVDMNLDRWLKHRLFGFEAKQFDGLREITTPTQLHTFLTSGLPGPRKLTATVSTDGNLISYRLSNVNEPIVIINPEGPLKALADVNFRNNKRLISEALLENKTFYSKEARNSYVPYLKTSNDIESTFSDWGFKKKKYLSGGVIFETPEGTLLTLQFPGAGSLVRHYDQAFHDSLALALKNGEDFVDPLALPLLQKASLPDYNLMWMNDLNVNRWQSELEDLGWKVKIDKVASELHLENPHFKENNSFILPMVIKENGDMKANPDHLKDVIKDFKTRLVP